VVAAMRWERYLSQYPRASGVSVQPVEFLASDPLFDMTNALIPRDEILSGGPPKDGIPSITSPGHVPVSEFELPPGERVIGIAIGGEEVAYPLALLNWHECVNDVVGGVPIAVTYCPLCDSVAVFDRRVGGEVIEFGISGRLYNSNVLLYDRRSVASEESLWSQLQGRAVTGTRAGADLETLPFELTPWGQWRDTHPNAKVVAFPDPAQRSYDRNPYERYFADPENLMFPVQPLDDRLGRKERILGLAASGESTAVILDALSTGEHRIPIAGTHVTVEWDSQEDALRVNEIPEGVQAMHTFWFAWAAMHPETAITGRE
jgi:hypothetical protein